MCHARNQDPCAFLGVIPNEMFFQCPDTAQFTNWFTNYSSWYYILWYVSSIWICSHIWIPKSQRLASTEQMFGRPYYDGLILEQDILLNKRSDSGKIRFRLDVNRAPRYALNITMDSLLNMLSMFSINPKALPVILVMILMKKIYMKTLINIKIRRIKTEKYLLGNM